MRRHLVVVAAALALLASGCLGVSAGECNDQGGSCAEPTSPIPTGEVRGLVVMEGGPVLQDGTATRPLKNEPIALKVRSPTGETLVRHLTTDEHGSFSLRLQPGWYELTARANYPLLPPQREVNVKTGQIALVRFTMSIK
jgi:hypothetical protein